MNGPVTRALTATILVYQKVVSPLIGPRCRFYPSCSEFAKQCLGKYDLPVATRRIARRLMSCHPFHPGGIDLP